ncbi:MAG TPA: BON domain-containing protein [Kiloniellaceae bacterium]|nr:BON domain-containing protein [Kiloniellaceae bacterium]
MNVRKVISFLAMAFLVLGMATACGSSEQSESTGEYIDSSLITAKVKAALVDDPTVNALDVEVETYKDRVLLSGFVDSEAARSQAMIVASGVEGVREVENNIEIK